MKTDTGVAGLFRCNGGVGLGLGLLMTCAAVLRALRGVSRCVGLNSSTGEFDSLVGEAALVIVLDFVVVNGGVRIVDVDEPLASALNLSSFFFCSALRASRAALSSGVDERWVIAIRGAGAVLTLLDPSRTMLSGA